jgi:hypothetical protein
MVQVARILAIKDLAHPAQVVTRDKAADQPMDPKVAPLHRVTAIKVKIPDLVLIKVHDLDTLAPHPRLEVLVPAHALATMVQAGRVQVRVQVIMVLGVLVPDHALGITAQIVPEVQAVLVLALVMVPDLVILVLEVKVVLEGVLATGLVLVALEVQVVDLVMVHVLVAPAVLVALVPLLYLSLKVKAR